MNIKSGDKVTLDYIDLDPKLRKAFGKSIPNKVDGTVDEIMKRKNGTVWFTLKGSKPDEYMEELYPVERIVKLNGKKI